MEVESENPKLLALFGKDCSQVSLVKRNQNDQLLVFEGLKMTLLWQTWLQRTACMMPKLREWVVAFPGEREKEREKVVSLKMQVANMERYFRYSTRVASN